MKTILTLIGTVALAVSGFAADVFTHVFDTFALVWLRFAQTSDLGGHLSQ